MRSTFLEFYLSRCGIDLKMGFFSNFNRQVLETYSGIVALGYSDLCS